MYWKIKDRRLEIGKKTYVMGIVNVTPDSFSDGGNYFGTDDAVGHALQLAAEGVDILDIGGQSTRPGHTPVSEQEEWERIAPVLSALEGKTELPVSVDTYYPYVAERALDCGADIINDVSGVINPEMAEIIKNTGAGWIIMHNGGISENISAAKVVAEWMQSAIAQALELGVPAAQLCVDPGIGFGKDPEQNYELIRKTADIKPEGYPYLLGASRKRCIGAATGTEADDRDYGTAAAHTVGIMGGADIIRTHIGAGAVQAARVADAVKRGNV